jgi:hypothetical protein
MDESKFDEEMALNRAAFEQLRSQIRRDYTGQYVAIAFGRIIAVSPNFDEAVAAVNQLNPLPEHSVVFPAAEEPMFEPYEATYKEFLAYRRVYR